MEKPKGRPDRLDIQDNSEFVYGKICGRMPRNKRSASTWPVGQAAADVHNEAIQAEKERQTLYAASAKANK
jgi:hypothetical protein